MKLPNTIKVYRTTLITVGLFGVVIGLFLAKFGWRVDWLYVVFIILLSVIAVKNKLIRLPLLLLLGLSIGLLRGHQYFLQVQDYQQFFGKKVQVKGKVVDDTGYDDRRQTEFHLGEIKINDKSLPGRVRVRGFGDNSVSRGDIVAASGTFNKNIGTSRQGSLSFANIKVLQQENSLVNNIRGKFFSSVYSALPEPQASLGLGYLVGVRSSLPQDFSDQLSVVGLTHIIAVSGYNLTIIVQTVKRLFEKRSAYQTVVLSGLLIVGFLLVTGWSPSILRASIISGFSLLAWYYGRAFKPVLLIFLGAAITGLVSPLYVWGDVGWYLSFLAFAGVLILAPLLATRLQWHGRKNGQLKLILIETISAQLFALPYIAVIFGRISLIAPIANILVLPFIPLIMLLIFLLGLVGIVSPILGLWLALIPRAFLSYDVWIVQKLSGFKFAQFSIKLGWWQVAIIYCVILGIVGYLYKSYHQKRRLQQVDEIDWNLL